MKVIVKFLPLLLVVLLARCGQESVAPAPAETELSKVQAFMVDPVAMERGEALFVGTCAGYCHSLEEPNADALFLFDCQWKHGGSDQTIFDIVTTGIPNTRMVGFGNNFPEGEDDLWKIIAYLRSNQQACS